MSADILTFQPKAVRQPAQTVPAVLVEAPLSSTPNDPKGAAAEQLRRIQIEIHMQRGMLARISMAITHHGQDHSYVRDLTDAYLRQAGKHVRGAYQTFYPLNPDPEPA